MAAILGEYDFEGRIGNLTLHADNAYVAGLVYVTNGAILTIEPGTAPGEQGQRGGLISVVAQKSSRMVHLISQSYLRLNRKSCSWRLGSSETPQPTLTMVTRASVKSRAKYNSDGLGLYGLGASSNPADNSGILRYVRIEYAGYAFLPDKEINGLTFGGVGSNTIIDNVQVSYANDDSFEWFGGTVNCKHLISFRTLDDDFDTDNGFSGKVQFGISLRDSAVADISKSEAFESDNDANGSSLTPQTSAVFSNMTVLGPKVNLTNGFNNLFVWGAQIRRNSTISIFNSLIMGYPNGLYIDATKGVPTDSNIPNSLFVQNTIIAGCPTPILYGPSSTAPTGATAATITDWFNTPAYGNSILTNNADVGLTNPFNYTNPDFNPGANSRRQQEQVFQKIQTSEA